MISFIHNLLKEINKVGQVPRNIKKEVEICLKLIEKSIPENLYEIISIINELTSETGVPFHTRTKFLIIISTLERGMRKK